MKHVAWIVCERSGCWTAALRTTAARQAMKLESSPRIVEVRRFVELSMRLEKQPRSLVFVEVHEGNLADALAWLAHAQDAYRYARAIALLDYSLGHQGVSGAAHGSELDDVESLLAEAGASDVVDSPRRLDRILAIAERHRELVADELMSHSGNRPLAEWAKSLLPWQDR